MANSIVLYSCVFAISCYCIVWLTLHLLIYMYDKVLLMISYKLRLKVYCYCLHHYSYRNNYYSLKKKTNISPHVSWLQFIWIVEYFSAICLKSPFIMEAWQLFDFQYRNYSSVVITIASDLFLCLGFLKFVRVELPLSHWLLTTSAKRSHVLIFLCSCISPFKPVDLWVYTFWAVFSFHAHGVLGNGFLRDMES